MHHIAFLALMEVASPDLEKQGFFAVVFVNLEYNGQQEPINPEKVLCCAPHILIMIGVK